MAKIGRGVVAKPFIHAELRQATAASLKTSSSEPQPQAVLKPW